MNSEAATNIVGSAYDLTEDYRKLQESYDRLVSPSCDLSEGITERIDIPLVRAAVGIGIDNPEMRRDVRWGGATFSASAQDESITVVVDHLHRPFQSATRMGLVVSFCHDDTVVVFEETDEKPGTFDGFVFELNAHGDGYLRGLYGDSCYEPDLPNDAATHLFAVGCLRTFARLEQKRSTN
ncbi:hypothetical protein KA047_01035 [Candidatus Saccharibacteria bacterium]|nr:hypothetical protein [Candidatus Saccharibacteria bacterium]